MLLAMLPYVDLMDDFDQRLETDLEKIQRLTGYKDANIAIAPSSFSRDGLIELVLYRRRNFAPRCRQEAGMICRAGPKNRRSKKFRYQMLRLFSFDVRKCYDIAEKHYVDITEHYNLRCH